MKSLNAFLRCRAPAFLVGAVFLLTARMGGAATFKWIPDSGPSAGVLEISDTSVGVHFGDVVVSGTFDLDGPGGIGPLTPDLITFAFHIFTDGNLQEGADGSNTWTDGSVTDIHGSDPNEITSSSSGSGIWAPVTTSQSVPEGGSTLLFAALPLVGLIAIKEGRLRQKRLANN